MATLDFAPSNARYRTNSDQLILMAATTLTTTPTVTTNIVNLTGWEYLHIRLAYVKGSETTARFYIELFDGTSWSIPGLKAAASGGVSDIGLDKLSLTPANYAASDSVHIPPISVLGYQTARGYIYYAGGATPGTLAVTASASCTVKGR